jgi:hypothetical protein
VFQPEPVSRAEAKHNATKFSKPLKMRALWQSAFGARPAITMGQKQELSDREWSLEKVN